MYFARDRTVCHRLYLSGGRKRRCGRLFGIGLQPAGDFSFAAARRPGDEYPRSGRQPGTGRQDHAATAAAVCAGAPVASVDWQLGRAS